MARKLYGSIVPDTRSTPATRPANDRIESWVQTEYGRVTVELWADGEYRVSVNKVASLAAVGPDRVIAGGNVNPCTECHAPMGAHDDSCSYAWARSKE